MNQSKEELNFRSAIEELEEINQWFQQEDIDLGEGLEKLKRGKELISFCRHYIQEAENKFEEIQAKEHGTTTEEVTAPGTVLDEDLQLDFEA